MRIGAAFLLLVTLAAAGGRLFSASREAPGAAGSPSGPRGPYLLRQIFGDLPRSVPFLWGLVPGMRRSEIPPGADLGEEEKSADSPPSLLKEVGGRATVTFVFDGAGPEARLNHISVTLVQSSGLSPRTLLAHLTKIYGPADPGAPGGETEILGSWQGGSILLRHFPAARFFEVTLASPRPPSPAVP